MSRMIEQGRGVLVKVPKNDRPTKPMLKEEKEFSRHNRTKRSSVCKVLDFHLPSPILACLPSPSQLQPWTWSCKSRDHCCHSDCERWTFCPSRDADMVGSLQRTRRRTILL
ncbi:hypothetical protein VFPPC_18699 [Pochonia chlamydosporia 170]|uniref:Uncharacterized protein n=1 Tax=Pochonia chlamydosporia 170 TaxID=1380566 RepID=A0A219ATH3_METCM|nr:hypothetical protein VFPPC_18699 [Pochonia chlamydosporia 170]OWT43574.1 hypothetical protein VFPPC_18699 [Pochonia chlamydosporia 170]